jgi:VCBS repeat-containing protein
LVDSTSDLVIENAGEGNDIVFASVDYTIGPNIETLGRLVSGDAVVIGGAGDDLYLVDSTSALVNENPGEGNDTVYTLVDYTIGPNIEELVLFEGAGSINGSGNSLNNLLVGNSGHNVLDGKGGDDTMIGGAGSDWYYVDSTGDVVTENPDEGFDGLVHWDWVFASFDYTLGPTIEGLVLMEGAGNINGVGNDLNNGLQGNSGNNTLIGGLGDDSLNGGDGLNDSGGDDTLIGGAGNDSYVVDSTSDLVTENPGEGFDVVYASLDYILGPNIEQLSLFGTGNINGVGNNLNNALQGNSGNNTLIGGDGDDSLNGRGGDGLWGSGGDDTLIGGAGNDWYHVDSTSDLVIENPDEGTDNVLASLDYTLGPNIENLWLLDEGGINGSGNDLDNSLTGNYRDNVLNGGLGNDTLWGRGGDDTFVFAAGEADGDEVLDFQDSLLFVGFGTAAGGATFTQIGTTNQWQIHSGLDGHNEVITLLMDGRGVSVHASDYVFQDATDNAAPVATGESYSTNEDEALNSAAAGVLLNDTDADNDFLTAVLVSGVQHGTLALNANGSFSYTPDANYNGPDSFTYKAFDGGANSDVATVSLTVNAVNDAPVALADAYRTAFRTTLTIDAATGVLQNDRDVDGNPITAELVIPTAHGMLTLTADGSFSYVPDANYHGTDSFVYHATDGAVDSNDVTVQINVAARNVSTTRDFNGDGKSDILLQHDSGLPVIWTMDGATVTNSSALPNPGEPAWHVVAAADFNGDGKSDILLQHDNGLPSIWTMDGTTFTTDAALPNPGSDWHLL